MNANKKEDRKRMLKMQLKAKVRPHRPAAKVLEIVIAMTEDQIELMGDKIAKLEWELEYLNGLDPSEIDAIEGS